MKNIFLLSLALIFGLVFLAGCGESIAEKIVEESVESQTGGQVDIEDDGFSITDDEGNAYSASTDAELPADYPAAAKYYLGELSGASTLITPDGKMFSIVIETSDSLAEISNFYEDFLAADNWQDTVSLNSNDSVIVGGTLGYMSLSAVANIDGEDANKNIITQTVTVAE